MRLVLRLLQSAQSTSIRLRVAELSTNHPQRGQNVRSTLLPDGYVVLHDIKTDWAHVLTPLGALTWEFCDGEHSAGDIAQEICRLVDDSSNKSELLPQIEQLVAELRSAGLLS